MSDSRSLWDAWQSLLSSYRSVFTGPGWVRFVQWVTGLVLCDEDHFLTRAVRAIGLKSQWRALERFAEYGSWNRNAVEQETIRLIERECDVQWNGYRPVALDDTKAYRSSKKVWGVCTFREYTARSPNRATTVRAHNWVVLGDLIPGKPWWYLPHSSRLYFRKSQLPQGETFRTKLQLGTEMLQQEARTSTTRVLGVFDGAFANRVVVPNCLRPENGEDPRIEILTKLRTDACLHAPLAVTATKKRGRPRKWGQRLAAPKDHDQWDAPWEDGEAFLYGRTRRFRAKRLECRWRVSGPDEPVSVLALEVDGYSKPWYLVTSATNLTTSQIAQAYAARFRQEDGFRDHKQLMGMKECRAWTKEPILRTFQVQMVAMTLLRLIQFQLDALGRWWEEMPWYPQKRHASILDLRRLFWKHQDDFSQFVLQPHETRENRERHTEPRPQATRAA